ncbi:extracellular solute-binding protein [Agromyces sp. PvR057]|uniref:ABC transporter substrate-binding protein n=1 Tax=Agromyces sp. PvR057 TaxID=3156403 RepID=UPI003390C721
MKHNPRTRAVLAATTIAIFGLGLAACSSPAASDSADGPSEPVEITFSSWLRGSEEVVAAFNDAQDDVEVTFKQVASAKDNYTQISNEVEAGTAPDVVTIEYPRVSEMATQGVIQDITESAGDLVAEGFSPSVQSLVNFGGKTWSVPLDAGVLEFYYRADLFEQYGIEVPTTWEEYHAAAAKVAAADPNVRLGASILGDPALYAAVAWQNGATWSTVEDDAWSIDIDGSETTEAAAFHQGLIDEGLVWTDEAEVLAQKQAAGQLLSVVSGAWYGAGLASTYPEQAGMWKVAQVPSPTDEPSSAMYGGSSFAVTRDSEKTEAAVEFIRWMTTDPAGIEARISLGASTVFPVNEDARAAAVEAFDPTFYGGQDIYEIAAASLESIPEGWVWGPATPTTFTSLSDGSAAVRAGSAKLQDIFADAQDATVEDLENRGISVD